MTELLTIFLRARHPAEETNFRRLYPGSCSFGHNPQLGEGRNVKWELLGFLVQLLLHHGGPQKTCCKSWNFIWDTYWWRQFGIKSFKIRNCFYRLNITNWQYSSVVYALTVSDQIMKITLAFCKHGLWFTLSYYFNALKWMMNVSSWQLAITGLWSIKPHYLVCLSI